MQVFIEDTCFDMLQSSFFFKKREQTSNSKETKRFELFEPYLNCFDE